MLCCRIKCPSSETLYKFQTLTVIKKLLLTHLFLEEIPKLHNLSSSPASHLPTLSHSSSLDEPFIVLNLGITHSYSAKSRQAVV